MIFVTTGSMFPFDRLVSAMDHWSSVHSDEEVFAQIGEGTYVPKHMRYARMLPPARFRQTCCDASLLVAHAGMGSIICAAEIGRPILVCPRRRDLGEHNTDHQLHTAKWVETLAGVFVANRVDELEVKIEEARLDRQRRKLNSTAPEDFVQRLRVALLA